MGTYVIRTFFIISAFIYYVKSFNILGVFPYEGKSHFFVFKPLLVELANRGHNVTVISHFPDEKPIKNYHDISLAGKSPILERVFPIEKSYWSIIQITLFLVNFGKENCKLTLADENVQHLWKKNAKFDVVLMEQFQSDCALGLAHVLDAPVVALTSHTLMMWHFNRFGIQYHPAFMNFMFLDGGTKPTFYQRLERIIFKIYIDILYTYFEQRVDQNTLAQYFDNIPPLEELSENIKMLLLYQTPALAGAMYFPPNVKEVGGYHVTTPKELPADLKKFIEEAEHGVIYISFGSMLQANTTPKDKLDAIIGAISQLPQRIVWKWEENSLPGQPKNVYISSWLPQNDILAHPNVLAFYSHCGMLGTTEALHHGVPMIGMPVFGDQPANAAMMEESGLGVHIQIADLTKELLLEKIKTVLKPEFRANVKRLSRAYHDRPSSAMDTAVFWIEYTARQGNFSIPNPALTVPYYQYLYLDVIAFLILILVVLLAIGLSIKSILCPRSVIRKQSKKKTR